MYIVQRTDSDNADFQKLVVALDSYLAERNGDSNDFYAQFNKIDALKQVVVVYRGNEAVGCGAMKAYDSDAIEIKRMYVPPVHRGKGIAGKILGELESWAKELGYHRCILETGDDMRDAIGLYQKHDFQIIPNYGQYVNVRNSVCFEKVL